MNEIIKRIKKELKENIDLEYKESVKRFFKEELKNELYIGVPTNQISAFVISFVACLVVSLELASDPS